MTNFITKNASLAADAAKIGRRVCLGILGISLGITGSTSLFATDHGNHESEHCSIAIVVRQNAGSARACDPKTVRSLAKQGQVFEQNQMGMVSMLVIGPGYDPAEALKWFERSAS